MKLMPENRNHLRKLIWLLCITIFFAICAKFDDTFPQFNKLGRQVWNVVFLTHWLVIIVLVTRELLFKRGILKKRSSLSR